MYTAQDYITKLELTPHPEGGYYKQTYNAAGIIQHEALPPGYSGARSYSTGIYFLLEGKQFSALHKIKQDEMWHFYDGSPIMIHMIYPDGEYASIKLGLNLANGEVPQAVVPGGTYFGSEMISKSDFALVGCTVAPGFDFADFEMPPRSVLLEKFPEHKKVIEKITNP